MNSIKKSNRTRILECLFRYAPISRAAIVDYTDITPATVTTTTASLIEEKVIHDLGEIEVSSENTPGRKRILIDLNPEYAYGIGIELTEKYMAFCLTQLKGKIEAQLILPAPQKNSSNLADQIIDGLHKLLEPYEQLTNQIVGIGLAVPGKLSEDGMRLITDSLLWKNLDLSSLKATISFPMVIENNIRSMAYGQYLFSPEQCPENFALFHIGTGMYCAHMVNGELFIGNNFLSGEIGHTIVQLEGRRCDCGKYGCLQTYASERWLIQMAQTAYDTACSPILRTLAPSMDELTITHLLKAYHLGDELVRQNLSQALKYLSLTISNLAIIMNPTKIFLHGELFDDLEICRLLQDFTDTQLTFMGLNYSHNIQILPYDRLRGASGASAMSIYTYFIQK